MPIEVPTLLVFVPLVAVLAWIVFEDLRARRIPNAAVLALLALWPVQLLLLGRPSPWWSGLAASALVLGGGLLAWHFGVLGGGDVKLAAALSALVGLEGLLGFLIATALLGGVLALVLLAAAHAAPVLAIACARFVPRSWCGRLGSLPVLRPRGRGLTVPYGVAIAIAGLFTLLRPLPSL